MGKKLLLSVFITAFVFSMQWAGLSEVSAGTTNRVSVASDGTQGNNGSYFPSITSDSRYVAFHSLASNLVDGDTNQYVDVFVHDRQIGTTTRISVASDGTQANDPCTEPSISSDSRYVAFSSNASNLVDGDTNGRSDVFMHDRQTATTTRISVASDGTQGNDCSYEPFISSDGRYVAFESDATNLVDGDTNGYKDVFVHDRQTGTTTRVSVASDGTQGDDRSWYSPISSDGRYVAFQSEATNLLDGDTNSYGDVFVHDRQTGTTTRISVASDGTQGTDNSRFPSISSDGRYLAFSSNASNLVDGDTNSYDDVFVHSEAIPPVPDIKANGSDELVILNQGNNLNVSIALDPGDYDGHNADWWLLLFYYHPFTGSWVPIPLASFPAPLLNLPPVGILNTPGLPQGVFIFYFAVDMNANGTFDPAQLYSDLVVVLIQ